MEPITFCSVGLRSNHCNSIHLVRSPMCTLPAKLTNQRSDFHLWCRLQVGIQFMWNVSGDTFNHGVHGLLIMIRNTWVVLQKYPQLIGTHFSQVLNKLEKIFFHSFIKYHLPFHFIQVIQVYPSPNNSSMDFKVKNYITVDVATHVF